MKKIVLFLCFLGLLTSCEDVIDVELNEASPRLVIDASLNVYEDSSFLSIIKLTTTAPFFDEEIPVVDNAIVTVTDENGTMYPFTYTGNGLYTNELIPQPGIEYTLEIIYNNERYTATEQLEPVVPLEFVEQENDGGFSGEDIELKVFFTDPPNEENYYFFEGRSDRGNVFDSLTDQFFDGNAIFGFYVVEDLESGDVITFNLYGVDEQFYSFMFTLLQQAGEGGGGPFETQPATVRGNIINTTNSENFPLGYFRISEASTLSYTVE